MTAPETSTAASKRPLTTGRRPDMAAICAQRTAGVGKVEMWRGDVRLSMSVPAPFVWRCLSGSAVAPFPHPAHRTGHADFPHPALGQDFTPSSRATPSAVERCSELIGRPISMSFATFCVCLELRSLPSTRVRARRSLLDGRPSCTRSPAWQPTSCNPSPNHLASMQMRCRDLVRCEAALFRVEVDPNAGASWPE